MGFEHGSWDPSKRFSLLPILLLSAWLLPTTALGDDPVVKPAESSPNTGPRDPSLFVRLLASKAVRHELGIRPDQARAIDQLLDEVAYPLFLLRDQPLERKRDRLEELANKVETDVRKTLNRTQLQRLAELERRTQGWWFILQGDMPRRLQLSRADQNAIEKLLRDYVAEGSRDDAKLDQGILDLLNDSQKGTLAKLLGKPFDLSRIPAAACKAPEITGVTDWINTDQPLSLEQLRGQVVAIHFFAFGCSNCINNHPHYKDWHERFANKGVTILGVHTPETERERRTDLLRADVENRGIQYPIAVDAHNSVWNAWANNMWPSVYLIDKRGRVRYWWYGEMNWKGTRGEEFMRSKIEELLAEPDENPSRRSPPAHSAKESS